MDHSKIEADFQLIDHWLEELVVKNSIGALHDEDDRTIKHLDIYDIATGSFEEYHVGKLGLSMSFECNKKGDAGKKITVDVKIYGEFKARIESMDENQFKQMLLGSGTASLYSISRAVIATTTAQCLFSGLVRIPMINVMSFLASRAEKVEKEEGN